jgi:hypothetical protein
LWRRECSEIIKGKLFLSSYAVARSLPMLKEKKVTHIVNVAGDVCENLFSSSCKFCYKTYFLRDAKDEDVGAVFFDFAAFVDDALGIEGRQAPFGDTTNVTAAGAGGAGGAGGGGRRRHRSADNDDNGYNKDEREELSRHKKLHSTAVDSDRWADVVISSSSSTSSLSVVDLDDGHDDRQQQQPLVSSSSVSTSSSSGNAVLVHCVEGVSRSASLIISYLMITRKIDFFTAHDKVKDDDDDDDDDDDFFQVRSIRSVAAPNVGFTFRLLMLQKLIAAGGAFATNKKVEALADGDDHDDNTHQQQPRFQDVTVRG